MSEYEKSQTANKKHGIKKAKREEAVIHAKETIVSQANPALLLWALL